MSNPDQAQSNVRSFLKKQIKHAKDAWYLILISFVCFIIMIAMRVFIDQTPWLFVLYINLAMIFLVLLAQFAIINNHVEKNPSWLICGLAVLIISLFGVVALEALGQRDTTIKIIIQTMTLIWAPIGSGLIVGPIMDVGSQR